MAGDLRGTCESAFQGRHEHAGTDQGTGCGEDSHCGKGCGRDCALNFLSLFQEAAEEEMQKLGKEISVDYKAVASTSIHEHAGYCAGYCHLDRLFLTIFTTLPAA